MRLHFLFFLCVVLTSAERVVWSNLESFLGSSWYSSNSENGTAFSKPSDLDSTLQPLDEGVTGNGVWSGNEAGDYFNFLFNISTGYERVIEANLTLKFYYSGGSGLVIYPCKDSGGYCFIGGQKTLEWHSAEFEIDVNLLSEMKIYSTRSSFIYLLDEVGLFYLTDDSPTTTQGPSPDACNESCEYKAIDCHNYYSCVDYKFKQYFECAQEEGLAFNPLLGVCDKIEFVRGCSPRGDECIGEYRPDLRNCSNYYFCPDSCTDELCELRFCPRGLLWSVDAVGDGSGVQQCSLPETAKCAEEK